MKTGKMFERDINRNINGVVKVNQIYDEVAFQELDEYVVTKEIRQHFTKFFNRYSESIDEQTDKIGIWVSGFFGSGKSHFIKILSYLLENKEVSLNGQTRSPLSFFEEKIEDPILLGNIKRAMQQDTDVILFNIDSKAEDQSSRGQDTVLQVFMKVFNELQGYCAKIPELAEMERYLDQQRLYGEFKKTYKDKSGQSWEESRDVFRLIPDDALESFAEITGQSIESARKWYEESEEKYSVSIEDFAKLVKDYLDAKGNNHRIIFLVDEVGQYIGEDTQLMLNLQTIVEDLGSACGGRAWVLVTAQEDIDAILGALPGARANDFSKIQGRFDPRTRISLSSTNTDEVIKRRLLDKTPAAAKELDKVYKESKDILKNQISFSADSASMASFADKGDFIDSFPFVPYQFDLLQKVFESIRKVGATGAHLARGERSMLDSFQQAVTTVQDENAEILIPFFDFYPAIRGFLEGVVISTIEKAADNPALEAFDQNVLKILFLIRYVDLVKANIGNLTTLCISRIDEDKLELRDKIESSLKRLEKETLIQRSGDIYIFLTNEERDVKREIDKMDLDHVEKVQIASEILFQDVFSDDRKHRFSANGEDYEFNRICDGVFKGNASADITVEIVTPLNEDYEHWGSSRCIMETSGSGKVVFKLRQSPPLMNEITQYGQTKKYVMRKDPASLPESIHRILQDHSADNRKRRTRIREELENLFATADVYALGRQLTTNAENAQGVRAEALEYLIENTYRKLGHLPATIDSPASAVNEIRNIMRSRSSGQLELDVDSTDKDPNYRAFNELQEHLQLCFQAHERVTLKDLTEKFARPPWGWPNWDVILLVAKLFRNGELRMVRGGEPLNYEKSIEPLSKTRYWKEVVIQKQPTIGESERKHAIDLVEKCFHEVAPQDSEELAKFTARILSEHLKDMELWKKEATYAQYPTVKFLERFASLFASLSDYKTAVDLLKVFCDAEDELHAFADEFQTVKGFHDNQKHIFINGRTFIREHRQNSKYYDSDSLQTWDALQAILQDPAPYSQIPKINGYTNKLKAIDEDIVSQRRKKILPEIEEKVDKLLKLAEDVGADPDTSNKLLYPIQQIRTRVEESDNIDSLIADQSQSHEIYERSWLEFEKLRDKKEGSKTKPTSTVRAARFADKPYIESDEDVVTFVATLQKELKKEIADGKRVQIR